MPAGAVEGRRGGAPPTADAALRGAAGGPPPLQGAEVALGVPLVAGALGDEMGVLNGSRRECDTSI